MATEKAVKKAGESALGKALWVAIGTAAWLLILALMSQKSSAAPTLTAPDNMPPIHGRLIDHGIYRCNTPNGVFFVDENEQKKYHHCQAIRPPKYAPAPASLDPTPRPPAAAISPSASGGNVSSGENTAGDLAQTPSQIPAQASGQVAASASRPPCRGAIVYKGNTYLFSAHEPCPIPEAVFRARKPLEAMPDYYLPQEKSSP